MAFSKRIEIYKNLSKYDFKMRRYSFKCGDSAKGVFYGAEKDGMTVNAERETVLRALRPFDTKYSVDVFFEGVGKQTYNGLYAMMIFNLCQKKYNAGKQK